MSKKKRPAHYVYPAWANMKPCPKCKERLAWVYVRDREVLLEKPTGIHYGKGLRTVPEHKCRR